VIFKDHTPLKAAKISDEQHLLLKSLWIESIEEAVAMGCALTAADEVLEKTGLKLLCSSTDILQTITPERLPDIQTARQGGGLGCLVEDHVMEDFHRLGQLRPTRATPTGAFETELPDSIRLIDRMSSIRDQGQRGTCVAFGSVALREFLLDDRKELSEQFLYWACKELDGHPGPGTYIHTAMSALAQYGVCRQSLWPYNPQQMDDEGQGPPPEQANEDARFYRLESSRTVEPNLIIHYKNVLAGDGNTRGMPVTFGSLVFNSWYMSSETHRTGKITLPLPGESPSGGHAWCIVGYVDDENVPGGGYFVIRNSWGVNWAADSPEAPGHAVMPYEYVERYTFEAFTGPSTLNKQVSEQEEPDLHSHVRCLDSDERDADGKLLKRGTKVLYHPLQPEIIREDTHVNQVEFIRLDKTWTPEMRQRIWFPPLPNALDDLADQTERCRTAKKEFLAAIDENVISARLQPIPEVKSLPFWFSILAWEPRIREVVEVADLTELLIDHVLSNSGVPKELVCPEDRRNWLTSMSGLKVYALSGMTSTVHVIAAVPISIHFQTPGKPVLLPPNQKDIDLIFNIYKQWSQSISKRAAFSFYSIASAYSWPSQITGYAAGDHWFVVSSLGDDGIWRMSTPPRFADRLSLRNFMDRLRPETRQQRISKIKHFVDELLDSGYEGNITLEKITNETTYRRAAIRDALIALQDSGHYRVYRTSDGVLAVGSRASKIGTTVRRKHNYGNWLARVACLGPAVSVGIWFVKDLILGRPFEVLGFIAMIPLAYSGEWLNTRFRKWREDKE